MYELAHAFKIAVSTLYHWSAAHPEFGEALKVGREAADNRVEAALYHRAVGYSYDAVKIMQFNGVEMIVPYVEHVPPSEGAMSLWLSNRRSKDWKIKASTEITGKDGAPIQIEDARATNLDVINQLSARLTSPTPGEAAAGSATANHPTDDTGADEEIQMGLAQLVGQT